MNWTTRCPHYRGPCLAVAASIFIFGLLLFRAESVAWATGDFGIAENGLYLQAGSDNLQGQFTGVYDLNSTLGAARFYDAGLTGTNAVMANIEAGYIWTGHETLTHVNLIQPSAGAADKVDRHATFVGMVLGGRPGGTNPGPYQRGMAPDAQLFSGSIATSWPPQNSIYPRYTTAFHFNESGLSTFGPFLAAYSTGLSGANGARTADVINVSWGSGRIDSEARAGNDQLAGGLDALGYEHRHTMLVTAAGNTREEFGGGAGPNKVISPATGFNDLTVAALAPNGVAYDIPSVFSNGGPNDYGDPLHGIIGPVRQVVDIAAPGENFATAYYGGQTGGNGPSVFGPPNGPAGGPDWYSRSVRGTSFATPTVAGGAALLYDAAYASFGANPDARDTRVMKAVLLNSADKTLGWNNGQAPHPNGNGGVLTTQALDNRVGVGRLNLDRAFDQFLSGTTDVAGAAVGLVGQVQPIGWDFGQVVEGATNDYVLGQPLVEGSTFTATLDWFRKREVFGLASFTDVAFDNLDLELWQSLGGTPLALVSESKSTYNNVEHFSFNIPTTGEYLLRVRLAGEIFDVRNQSASDYYGLAWYGVAVPEPAAASLVALAAFLLAFIRRR